MWIRKYLFLLLLVMLPTSFFCFKNYNIFKTKIEYINDYKKVRVKVDSVDNFAMNGGVRDGNVKNIYYNNYRSTIKVDEDAKNNNYIHFGRSNRDSMYVWHNANAEDIYTTKESKPLDVNKFKSKMYFNLSLIVLTIILVLWCVYIMFIEKGKNISDEEK